MTSDKQNMIRSNFGKKFIMGGLTEINDINVKIRKLQINDGVRLHTCNDYGNSLEVIKIASTGISPIGESSERF